MRQSRPRGADPPAVRFLPDPITVTVDGDEVMVGFPEKTPGSRAEAARLAEKARKRDSEGNHPNPKDRK